VTSARACVIATALCVLGYLWVYGSGLADEVVRSDGYSYYVYVPSWLLYGDTTLTDVARDCCGGVYPSYTGIVRWPGTRRWLNVHPIGVAIMQAPFFPIAHLLTRWSNLTPDGFSLYYQHAVGLAGLIWGSVGLWLLRSFLQHYFRDIVIAATILAMTLGTNLLHYATFDVSYSHIYSFFLFAALLALTVRWRESPSTRRSLLLGIVVGLIVLTRHTNVLVLAVLFIPFRVHVHGRQLAILVCTAVLVVLPQLLIYYQATGRPIVSSYGELGFNWTSPRVFDVLFGVTKGLFFWSPLVLFAVGGFVLLLRPNAPLRPLVVAGLTFLAAHTYLIAAWWDWQLGGSFGSRGFVETLPLFAIGLATFLERCWNNRAARLSALSLVSLCCALSVFQMFQYWYGIIPFDNTTWDRYRDVFLRWR
jgi:hypothetical protein